MQCRLGWDLGMGICVRFEYGSVGGILCDFAVKSRHSWNPIHSTTTPTTFPYPNPIPAPTIAGSWDGTPAVLKSVDTDCNRDDVLAHHPSYWNPMVSTRKYECDMFPAHISTPNATCAPTSTRSVSVTGTSKHEWRLGEGFWPTQRGWDDGISQQ